jgi:hypothetical protein
LTLSPALAALPVNKDDSAIDSDNVTTPYIVSYGQPSADLPTLAIDLETPVLKDDRPVEDIDMFLLPAYSEPLSPAAKHAAGEEDLVVVDENSDKDGWSDKAVCRKGFQAKTRHDQSTDMLQQRSLNGPKIGHRLQNIPPNCRLNTSARLIDTPESITDETSKKIEGKRQEFHRKFRFRGFI